MLSPIHLSFGKALSGFALAAVLSAVFLSPAPAADLTLTLDQSSLVAARPDTGTKTVFVSGVFQNETSVTFTEYSESYSFLYPAGGANDPTAHLVQNGLTASSQASGLFVPGSITRFNVMEMTMDSATPTGDYAVGFGGQTPYVTPVGYSSSGALYYGAPTPYHFTVLPAATAVPEPSGAVPFAVAAASLLGLALRVRRRGSRR